MNAKKAADLINNGLIFKPGWDVSAIGFDAYDTVLVRAELLTTNFDREEAPYYRGRIIAGGTFELSTKGSQDEVLQRLLTEFVKIEEHEWREALRLKSNYDAPFHPHRPEGQDNWARAVERLYV